MRLTQIFILISMLISINSFSFCESNDKKDCLNFNYFLDVNIFKNVKLVDMVKDDKNNKYVLLNAKLKLQDIFFIMKFNDKNDLVWSKYIKGVSSNILLNGKGEIIISSYFTGKIKLESKKYAFNTKSLLLLKLDNVEGKLKSHLFVSTNYGVIPIVTKLDKENNIYIGGYYGGKSDFFENSKKPAYEDAFLLVLDDNFNKMWSKSFRDKSLIYVNDLKVGKDKLYLALKKASFNSNTLIVIDKKDMKHSVRYFKEVNMLLFDIDSEENIYLIDAKFNLKKFNKEFKEISSKLLKDFEYSVTPSQLLVKNDNLLIQYIINVEYKKNILISNYDLNLKNNWHFAITGQTYVKSKLKLIDDNLFIFGEYQSNLTFLDKDFYSIKPISFVLSFTL